MDEPVLAAHDLRKRFGHNEVLAGVDLAVAPGSVHGFLGPNGAGKTTTMKILMGLLRPSSGSATIFGHDVRRAGPAARTHVGYLPQHPRFHPWRSVRDILGFVARLSPGTPPRHELAARIEELLDLVGLADKADRRVRGLSGGEMQRLGLAQALVSAPDLLILDEPAASLDPQGRHDVLDLLARLRGRVTIFYSTHILDDVQRVSDRVTILTGGRPVADGPLEDLLAIPRSSWTIRVANSGPDLESRVADQPWVTRLVSRPRAGQHVWRVELADDGYADRLLPAVLSDPSCDVVEFHPTDPSLEDAYLEIVGADRDR